MCRQTIGGTVTAYSASLVASAAKAANMKLSCVHVPKSIFNDLPLPENAKTFGYDTARQARRAMGQREREGGGGERKREGVLKVVLCCDYAW